MHASWTTWALLSAFFAALTAIFAKIGVREINSDLATLLRTFVVVIALTALVVGTHKWSNPIELPNRTLLFLVLSGLATAASWLCYFRAIQLGPVALVAPIDKFSVVLVAMFAYAMLGERPTAREWMGIVLVTAGVAVIALRK
jgi:bacterial/archaeal transporter family protein